MSPSSRLGRGRAPMHGYYVPRSFSGVLHPTGFPRQRRPGPARDRLVTADAELWSARRLSRRHTAGQRLLRQERSAE